MKIAVRCDANQSIGLGHFYRDFSLALAAIEDGHEVVFLMAETNESLLGLLADAGIGLQPLEVEIASNRDLEITLKRVERFQADAVILDGYRFDAQFSESMDAKVPTLVLDDLGDLQANVSGILNVNVYAEELSYRVPERTRLLLGVRFALLRPQFRRLRPDAPKTFRKIRRIFVSMGGGDPHDTTRLVIESLAPADVLLEVMIGSSYSNAAELEELVRRSQYQYLEVHRDIPNPSTLMDRCDLAIANAGGTTWELACLGIPMLHIVNADNQRLIAEKCRALGVSKVIGEAQSIEAADIVDAFRELNTNPSKLNEMSRAGWNLVDGRGPQRVLQALEEIAR